MITGSTRLLGVMGHPVEHSLSPIMHNAAIAHLGADFVYIPLPVAPDNLPKAIAGLEALGVRGFNLTIPHKQAIMPMLAEVSELAQAIGAVNTVWWTPQGWSGTNTDVAGFLAPLEALGRDWRSTTAVVLGNGGAARAVVAGCGQLGCQTTYVVGRSADKLAQFQQSWQGSPLAGNLQVRPWEQLADCLAEADLIVNTTPIGMTPHPDASPLDAALAAQIRPGAIAYDLIYTPSPTRFLQQAEAQGAIAIDGLEMLICQGAAGLEIWLEQPVPVAVMRQALHQHLGRA